MMLLAWLAFSIMTVVAVKYREDREALKVEISELEAWIDDIITALEDSNEEKGNEEIDSLVAQMTED